MFILIVVGITLLILGVLFFMDYKRWSVKVKELALEDDIAYQNNNGDTQQDPALKSSASEAQLERLKKEMERTHPNMQTDVVDKNFFVRIIKGKVDTELSEEQKAEMKRKADQEIAKIQEEADWSAMQKTVDDINKVSDFRNDEESLEKLLEDSGLQLTSSDENEDDLLDSFMESDSRVGDNKEDEDVVEVDQRADSISFDQIKELMNNNKAYLGLYQEDEKLEEEKLDATNDDLVGNSDDIVEDIDFTDGFVPPKDDEQDDEEPDWV